MKIREGVFDRLEDAYGIFKKNIFGLVLPLFLYNFLSIVLIGTLSKYLFIKNMSGLDNLDNFDVFTFLNNSTVVLLIVVAVFLFILYLIIYIFVFLGLLESIRQSIKGEKITISDNLLYGIKNFGNSMKTYWYIFAYIALIPSIIFILGGMMFNLSYYYTNLSYLSFIGGGLMIVSLVIFIVYSIYRGTKAKFGLFSAVNGNDFSKENFVNSVKYTDNNWWRIIGNFLLVGILVGIIGSIISGIASLFSFGLGGGSDMLESVIESFYNKDVGNIKNIIESYLNNFSFILEVTNNIIDNFILSFTTVFVTIFTYLLYLRLGIEFLGDKSKNVNNNNNNNNSDNNLDKNIIEL